MKSMGVITRPFPGVLCRSTLYSPKRVRVCNSVINVAVVRSGVFLQGLQVSWSVWASFLRFSRVSI